MHPGPRVDVLKVALELLLGHHARAGECLHADGDTIPEGRHVHDLADDNVLDRARVVLLDVDSGCEGMDVRRITRSMQGPLEWFPIGKISHEPPRPDLPVRPGYLFDQIREAFRLGTSASDDVQRGHVPGTAVVQKLRPVRDLNVAGHPEVVPLGPFENVVGAHFGKDTSSQAC